MNAAEKKALQDNILKVLDEAIEIIDKKGLKYGEYDFSLALNCNDEDQKKGSKGSTRKKAMEFRCTVCGKVLVGPKFKGRKLPPNEPGMMMSIVPVCNKCVHLPTEKILEAADRIFGDYK